MLLASLHRLGHDQGVAGMESTSHVGMVDEGDQFVVGTGMCWYDAPSPQSSAIFLPALEVAISLAELLLDGSAEHRALM